MALQNRVTPLGELVADPARGLVYGNRGCLHDEERPHPPALQRQALDRLPARVPRLAARAAAPARPLHRALLPRRGDRLRRRPPPLRTLPARRLRPLRRDLAHDSIPARSEPTRSTLSCTASASIPARATPAPRARRSTSFPTAPSSCTTERRSWCSAQSCSAGRPPVTGALAATRRRRRRAGHAAVAGRGSPRRLGAGGAALPPVHAGGVSSPDGAAGRQDPRRHTPAVLGRRRRSRARPRRPLGLSRQHRGLLVLADQRRPVADLHGRGLRRRCVLLRPRGARLALARPSRPASSRPPSSPRSCSSSPPSTGTGSTTAMRPSGPPSRSTPGS